MRSHKAFLPGSFDPITKGHLNLITRAVALFEKLYVVVCDNSNKKHVFSLKERYQLVQKEIAHLNLRNVIVIKLTNTLVIDKAQELNVQFLVRCIRNSADIDTELLIANNNHLLAPNIESVILFSRPDCAYISSTLCWEIIRCNGSLQHFVSPLVEKAMKKKVLASK